MIERHNTPGQISLDNLTLLLNTVDVGIPNILRGWIDKIRFELDAAASLLATSDALVSKLDSIADMGMLDSGILAHSLPVEELRTAIAKAKETISHD